MTSIPRCDECNEDIPDEEGGGLVNEYHAPSCSLFEASGGHVTRAQAEQALAAIIEQFGVGYDSLPELVENWRPFIWRDGKEVPTGTYRYAIVWEDGPYEWAYRAKDGGHDEELTLEARSVAGGEKMTVSTPAANGWPKAVALETYFSYAITLYEA